MDEAANDLIHTLDDKIFDKMTTRDFMLAKKKTLDTITATRLDLQKQSERHFRKILDNNYNFQNFLKMEKYSKSITFEDFIRFYDDVFINHSLKMTIWVINY
jgi:secreted Zn-dependent insulinase-like peptidase